MENSSRKSVELAATVSRVVGILSKLNPADQQRAIAASCTLLEINATGGDPGHKDRSAKNALNKNDPARQGEPDPGELALFFDRGDKKADPTKNVLLCAAWHFKRYGMATFSLSEIKEIASEAGVVIPNRPDMTFRSARKNGKKYFATAGKQIFKPTATGGHFLQTEFGTRPGRETKQPMSEQK